MLIYQRMKIRILVMSVLTFLVMGSLECWASDEDTTTLSASAKSDVAIYTTDAKAAVARKEFKQAASLYQHAADLGDTSSMYELGQIYSAAYGADDFVLKSPTGEAERWYKKAADRGSAAAMYNVGFIYFNANHGAMKPEDLAASLPWFQKSADLGYAPAITQLGVMYKSAFGVPQDDVKAAQYFLKAAQMGDAQAMENLGYMYNQGTSVTADSDKAVYWWKKAVATDPNGQSGKAAQTWLDVQGVKWHGP